MTVCLKRTVFPHPANCVTAMRHPPLCGGSRSFLRSLHHAHGFIHLHLAASHIHFCHHLLRQPHGRWPSVLKTRPIASRQAQHVSGAARLAGRLFAERPKAFRRPIKWFVASAPPAASLATDQFSGCGRTDADPRCFPPLIHLKTLPLLWSDVFITVELL